MNFFHLPLKHASWKKVLVNKQKKTCTVIRGCFCLTKERTLWLDMFKFTFMDFFHHKNPFVGQLYSLEWPRSFTWQKSSIVSFEILYHWCVMSSKWVVWKLNCRIQIKIRKISLLEGLLLLHWCPLKKIWPLIYKVMKQYYSSMWQNRKF